MTADPSSSFNSRSSFDFRNFDTFTDLNLRKKHKDKNIKDDHPNNSNKSKNRSYSSKTDINCETNCEPKKFQNYASKSCKKITNSSEAIRNLVLANADLINSFDLDDIGMNLDAESFRNESEALPAKMWWVPPMKSPSYQTVPSVHMSSTPYSINSSSIRPKVIKSAEDLRQQVFTECSLVEAKRQAEERFQTSDRSGNHYAMGTPSPVELWWIPPIKIPSDYSRSSATMALPRATYIKSINSTPKSFSKDYMNLSKSFSSNCNMLNQPDLNGLRDIYEDSHLRVPDNSSYTCKDIFIAESHNLPKGSKFLNSTSTQASESDNLYFPKPPTNPTIGDLACKHIVNPMMTKLARLCTQQGQQYLEVLDDLQKACDDFHNACKDQVSKK